MKIKIFQTGFILYCFILLYIITGFILLYYIRLSIYVLNYEYYHKFVNTAKRVSANLYWANDGVRALSYKNLMMQKEILKYDIFISSEKQNR